MPFAASDNARLRKHLLLPFSYRTQVQVLMDAITEEATIALIVSDLNALDNLETSLTTNTGKRGVKKVGDIEFFEGGEITTTSGRYEFIVERVSTLLNIASILPTRSVSVPWVRS